MKAKTKTYQTLLLVLLCVNVLGTIIKAIYLFSQGLPELVLTALVFYVPTLLGLILACLGGGWGWLLCSLFFSLGLGLDGPLVVNLPLWLCLPVPIVSAVLTLAALILRHRMTKEERLSLKKPEMKKTRRIVLIAVLIVYAAFLLWLLCFSGGQHRVTPIGRYYTPCEQAGTVEKLEYDSFVYDDNGNAGEAMPKYCYVYLPYGYDASKTYPILYLSHGGGGAADNWLIEVERDKHMVDHMIANGECEPLIIVTPSFYQFNDSSRSGQYAVNLTAIFRYELRNDLIPAVEAKYATYANRDTSIESLQRSRDYRAFAGLSMGSMTTWSSALCGSLDLFSWFGPYSAGGDAEQVLQTIHDPLNADYPIHYIYNANGTADMAFVGHRQMYNRLLQDPYFIEGENITFTTLHLYMHDWPAWTIDLYNTLHVFFR